MSFAKLRIGIIASGRFHVLDLARELAALGHHVLFYSAVPPAQTARFGLRPENTRWLGPVAAGLIWTTRRYGGRQREFWDFVANHTIDRLAARAIEECDVVIGLSGLCVESFKSARRRFGAKIIVERGSQHMLAQAEILAGIAGARRPSTQMVKRELAGYQLADWISIPSVTVERSFERDPAAYAKLLKNSYGVDLGVFKLMQRPRPRGRVTFVFAGVWSAQKGCDLLVDAVRALPHVCLVHVGPLGDVPFPNGDPQFLHHANVDQSELPRIYRMADAFVLASRQDGFGMVLSQALATGLPIVCTTTTGGPDLRLSDTLTDRITIVASGEMEALRDGLGALSQRLLSGPEFSALSQADLETLTWSAYGRRYSENLQRLLS